MIAYDSLLWAECNDKKDRWNKILDRAAMHKGQSYYSGALAGALYGCLYGKSLVVRSNYNGMEYQRELEKCAVDLVNAL